jgi:endonuclease YncB( thermonuclease family)
MRSQKLKLTVLVFLAGLMTVAASKSQTFTGEVSDAMCGAKHMMAGNADCTRACVAKGSNYSLVVADKVYVLHTANKATLDQLSQLAGEQAKVTGTADGDTIEVSKVAAAK